MANPLSLPAEEMRALGYRAIDAVVEHLGQLAGKPVISTGNREDLERRVSAGVPEAPADAAEVMRTVLEDVFGSIGRLNHPRYFAFIPSPSNFVSVLADLLTSAYTPFCGTWLAGSGPAMIELRLIRWLAGKFGLPETAGGLFESGGSIANLTALAAARDRSIDAERHVLYCSDQTHSSIDRAVKLLGYRAEQLRKLAGDERGRLPFEALQRALEEDKAAGRQPAVVIANAGTTATGAVDPLRALAALCRQHGMWLHVDAAYGGAAILTRRGESALEGIGKADSITLDPHKWLFQPYAIGCVLVRDADTLASTFRILPEYLRDTAAREGWVNYCDHGPELTRPFRALKLWMSLQVFGEAAFTEAIEHGFEMARLAEQVLRRDRLWEIVTAAQMGIVTFRFAPPGMTMSDAKLLDRLNHDLAEAARLDGHCFVSTTVFRGRLVLRLCPIHPATTAEDIETSLAKLRELGWNACVALEPVKKEQQ